MRYAVISDIHGNLEALQAVVEALVKEGPDKYLFLGDVVGYGADPVACISLLKSLSPEALVAGNHEWGVLGQVGISYFNDAAKAAIEWTKAVMGKADLEYIKSFKLLHETDRMSLVHGTVHAPADFDYILNEFDAYGNMKYMKRSLCFVGHSHVAGIYYNDARVKCTLDRTVMLPGKKYVVNPGSVGQPRDSDPRASFAIYDDSENTVELKRVPYDIKKAQDKILKAGLPAILAYRLSQGR